MFIIKNRRIFFTISGLLVGLSLLSVSTLGLDLGIDFTGGSILEVDYAENRPAVEDVSAVVLDLGLVGATLQPTGETGLILRLRDITPAEKNQLDEALTMDGQYDFSEERFSSIGPVLGAELARKGFIAIGLVVLLIIVFIAFVFRSVTGKISSWKYGLIAVVTLCHDIIIPIGVMSVIGYYTIAEVDALFLTALLAILGLSVNDTIVVFDRVRENLKNKISPHFEEVVGISLRQTIARSINTSLTTIVVLAALFILGGQSTKYFALTLAVGMAVGTYSSIFLAAPLLVAWEKISPARVKKD